MSFTASIKAAIQAADEEVAKIGAHISDELRNAIKHLVANAEQLVHTADVDVKTLETDAGEDVHTLETDASTDVKAAETDATDLTKTV